ncbi:efflux RND transporter permease subunit [Escherichia coli]
MVGETAAGIARYPIKCVIPQSWRDSPQALRQLPILTPMSSKSPWQTWPTLKSLTGPSMLKTECAPDELDLYRCPAFVWRRWFTIWKVIACSGVKTGHQRGILRQFELLACANHKLKLMVPMTLMIIFALFVLGISSGGRALPIISSVPFALVGGIWFAGWWMGFHLSVATGTGFVALAGVAAEFGVVMRLYDVTRIKGRAVVE